MSRRRADVQPGIYRITNTVNGKLYVGSTVNPKVRWVEHLRDLRRGTHYNARLQNAWTKYGEAAFTFEVVEHCESEELITREQFWIDTTQAADRNVGYNMRPVADSPLGTKLSAETRAKMSAAHQGLPTPETLKKIIAHNKSRTGSHPTEETKAKISRALKLAMANPDTRSRMSVSSKQRVRRRGYKITGQALENLRAAGALRRGPSGRRHSPETRAKMSASAMGRKGPVLSQEARDTVRRKNTGKVRTPEMRERYREAQKDKWKDLEYRAHFSAVKKELLADPEWRAQLDKKMAEVNAKPEVHARRSAASKRNSGTPEARAHHSEVMNTIFADPERKAALMAKRIASHEKNKQDPVWLARRKKMYEQRKVVVVESTEIKITEDKIACG